MIANLVEDKKPIEIKVPPPEEVLEEVIILNSNDVQFGEMEMECTDSGAIVNDSKK